MGASAEDDLLSDRTLIVHFAVDGGVQDGVVIHLELAIKLEPPGAGECLAPQHIEATGEVGTLLASELRVASRLRSAWPGGAVGAFGLLSGMVDLQRQNRKPVDHEAGRLGVEWCAFGLGSLLRLKPVEERAVQFFGEIVAKLVGWSMRRLTPASCASVAPGVRASSSMCQRSKLARC